jgi:hypothetical protein
MYCECKSVKFQKSGQATDCYYKFLIIIDERLLIKINKISVNIPVDRLLINITYH